MTTTTTIPSTDIDYGEFVETAIVLMERYYFATDTADWETVRQATAGLGEELTPEQAYGAIERALQTLSDPHSYFLRPQVVEVPGSAASEFVVPAGERMGNVGYLTVPVVAPPIMDPDNPKAYADALNQLLSDMDSPDPVCGWVVDLRENRGGVIGPMFASLGPLLGEGVVLTATGPIGTQIIAVGDDLYVNHSFESASDPIADPIEEFSLLTSSVTAENVALGEAAANPTQPPHRIESEAPPVALLLSNTTASAGEYVTVAFLGRPDTRTFGNLTAGIPTSVRGFEFTDGAILGLAVGVPSDRQGRSYDTHIQPDELVPFSAPGEDRPLDAALEWLASHPSCQ